MKSSHYLIIVQQQKLRADATGAQLFTRFSEVEDEVLNGGTFVEVGHFNNEPCYVLEVENTYNDEDLVSFRTLMGGLPEEELLLSARALQLLTWRRQHRYCGQCGQETVTHSHENALHCESCEIFYYPKISPCIMCLITNGDYCLLANHRRYTSPIYSTLAGFVEAGETLEHAIHREVQEEVGLKLGNVEYFGSQSWPFPHQLMVGFFADYSSGDIVEDGDEIVDAQWFHYEKLPQIPENSTLSGKLIDEFVGRRRLLAG